MIDIRIYVLTFLAILISIPSSMSQMKKQLTEADAIRLAEQFVAENGYTDLPPLQDKTKLSYESIDSSEPEERLRKRYNTLERYAYAVGKADASKYGWTIVFRYKATNERYRQVVPNDEEHIKKVGRAVIMDADGNNIRMQHQDIYLKALKVIEKDDR